MHIKASTPLAAEQVLSKAILNMAKLYRLNGKDLSELLGISEAGVSRIHLGKKDISPEHKEVSTLWVEYNNLMKKYNIPTKLTTINYNGQIQEIYE